MRIFFILFALNCGFIVQSFADAIDQENGEGVVLVSLGRESPSDFQEDAPIPSCVETRAYNRIVVQIQAYSEQYTFGCKFIEDSIVYKSVKVEKFDGKNYRFYRYAGKMRCNYVQVIEVEKIVQYDGENCH